MKAIVLQRLRTLLAAYHNDTINDFNDMVGVTFGTRVTRTPASPLRQNWRGREPDRQNGNNRPSKDPLLRHFGPLIRTK